MNIFCEDSTNKDKHPQKGAKILNYLSYLRQSGKVGTVFVLYQCAGTDNVIYALKKRIFRLKSTQDCQFIIIFAKILHIFE